MQSNVMRLKELIELAQDLGLDECEWFVNGLWKLSLRWDESLFQRLWDIILSNNFKPLLDTTFTYPIRKDDLEAVDGPYKIGTIANTDIEFGFHPVQLQMHGLFGGSTGFGKSTLVKVLCPQILARGETLVWIIDPKGEGGDFRFLAKESDNVIVLRPDVLKCNPFSSIPNVPVEMLRESVSEVTADSWGLFDASEGVILKHINRVLEQYERPTAYDFISSLRNNKEKGYRWDSYRGTIETRLTKAEISLGRIFDCVEDYFPKLYDKNVVFEIGELSGSAQRVLVPWIIMKLVLYKIKNPTRHLSHVLLFDEAQSQVWSRTLEQRGRQSYMATLATQARAFGLGIMVLAQNPATKLMTEIIANSAIKLIFHLGSGVEIQAMSQHMGLTYEQMDTLHHLKIGEAICRVGLGYTEPVHLEIHNFQDQPVSNDELAEMMKPKWDELLEGIEPARPEPKQLIETGGGVVPRPKAAQRSKVSGKAAVPPGSLTPDEQNYLRTHKTHPWRLTTERYAIVDDDRIMGTGTISQSRAVKIRKKLQKLGYLNSFTVPGTGRSGRPQCDVVTEKANMGMVKKPRGDNEHACWCYRTGEFFRKKGGKIKIGDTVSGHEVDVSVEIGSKFIGLEIVISTLVVDNLRVNLSCYDEMLILCVDEKMKKKVTKQIEDLDDIRDRITVRLLKEYFIAL